MLRLIRMMERVLTWLRIPHAPAEEVEDRWRRLVAAWRGEE
jgi:hypothetical protein